MSHRCARLFISLRVIEYLFIYCCFNQVRMRTLGWPVIPVTRGVLSLFMLGSVDCTCSDLSCSSTIKLQGFLSQLRSYFNRRKQGSILSLATNIPGGSQIRQPRQYFSPELFRCHGATGAVFALQDREWQFRVVEERSLNFLHVQPNQGISGSTSKCGGWA
jgi:hypothetical protein